MLNEVEGERTEASLRKIEGDVTSAADDNVVVVVEGGGGGGGSVIDCC